MTVVVRMYPDNTGLATGNAGLVATDAVRFQRYTLVPGWRRTQRVLPFHFFGAALAGQKRAA